MGQQNPTELEKNLLVLSVVRPEDLTVDGTLDSPLDPQKVDAFYISLVARHSR